MLDKESEIYHSGILNLEAQRAHFAFVVTREGVEVSAAKQGLRFEYSDTWEHIRRQWEATDKKRKERREERAVFMQNVPASTNRTLEGN